METKEKILKHLTEECMLTDKAEVEEYVTKRKNYIIKQHIENVFPIREPGETGGNPNYWMTKLDPKNRNHCKPIYAKSEDELRDKIISHYLKIKDDSLLTVEQVLHLAVDANTPTGKRTIQRFHKNLSSLSKIVIKDLEENSIRNALDLLIKMKVTVKEFNESITCLNKIAEYCDYEHVEICNIKAIVATFRKVKCAGKHVFKDNTKLTSNLAFNREEAQIIVVDALNNPSNKSLAVALLIVTGLRSGELLALSLEDIYLDDGFIWVHRAENTKTYELCEYVKENKPREVYLSNEAKLVIRTCIDFRNKDESDIPFLFLNSNSEDGKMHLRAIDDYLREHVHKNVLGYDCRKEARSAHDCRRTYASLEYLNGTDILDIKEQLGHSSTKQTEEYIKAVIDGTTRQARLKGCNLNID